MDEAFTYYQRAMEASDPDVVIANLDACLVLDPPPQIAMFAYRNIAGAIWEKFSFAQRSGKTISNEEFWWAQRASECLRRVLVIFGRLSESDQHEPEVKDCHENSTKFLQSATAYGLYYSRAGEMRVRDMKRPAALPRLRCLDDSAAASTAGNKRCPLCDTENPANSSTCRYCSASF
jgi:hypothetical protein